MSAQQAPNFTLPHITGRQVSLSDFRGRPVVVLFAGRDSNDQARQATQAIRGRYGPAELPLIAVIDLHTLPKLIQGMAKGRLQSSYQEAVQEMTQYLQARGQQPPADMSQIVVMLPDWEGKTATNFGLSGVDKQAVMVLIDGDGYVRGYGAGAQAGEQVLSLFG
jgi:AhpC/TSA family